jgi:hypothetical protein
MKPYQETEFRIPGLRGGVLMRISIHINDEWEHVAISLFSRFPVLDEIELIRTKFFYDHETVMQFHPENFEPTHRQPFTVHLWHPLTQSIALPPKEMFKV